MITIEQLLESVDLDFEPRWITKDKNGVVWGWACKPEPEKTVWDAPLEVNASMIGRVKLAEFEGKDWTECIYEIPRKATEKIEKITLTPATTKNTDMFIVNKINELVDAVNELKGAKNDQ